MKRYTNIGDVMQILGAILIIFFVMIINTETVSAKELKTKENYILILEERGEINEKIIGEEIGLKYVDRDKMQLTYDRSLLESKIDKLECFNVKNILLSQEPKLRYFDEKYLIANEVYGNEVDKQVLYNSIAKAIENGEKKLDLEVENCYKDPKVFSDSPSVINARDTLNKYISSQINYNIAGITKTVDKSLINNWLYVNENFQVFIDEKKVLSYVEEMAKLYTESLGKTINVSGGYNGNNHSWVIDAQEEAKSLIEDIKSGQVINKTPLYSQTAESSYFANLGDTFVEIDMTNQHLWYYKNGYLIVDGDVVTGNLNNGWGTPEGIYKLYYKQKDTVLRGADYESPVSYWMPFNGNIGLHDANWRSEFGSDIYKVNGSHGCVNASYHLAKTVYDNIEKDCMIICYN